jgi:hypothetical protein
MPLIVIQSTALGRLDPALNSAATSEQYALHHEL